MLKLAGFALSMAAVAALGFLGRKFAGVVEFIAFLVPRMTILTAGRSTVLFVASHAVHVVSPFQSRLVQVVNFKVFFLQGYGSERLGRVASLAGHHLGLTAVPVASDAIPVL
jgi:hypothetical protein